MSSTKLAFIFIILSTILWSAVGPLMKILYRSYDPFPLAFIRFFIAALVLLPIYLIKFKPKLNLKVILISFLSCSNILFFYLGIAKTTAIASSMIYAATPLIVSLLSYFLIKERLTKNKIIGIILGFIGVIIIVLLPEINHKQNIVGNLEGNILIFCAVISWSLYTIGSKYLISSKISPFVITVTSFISNTILF